MPVDQKQGFLGLVTNTSEGQAPDGALRIADNVVIRSAGVVENRDGFREEARVPAFPRGRVARFYAYYGAIHGGAA